MNQAKFSAHSNRYWAFLVTYFLATIIFIGLMIINGFAPFGKSTMLTYDLGQQYIDFFAYYKHTILEQPDQFFYSFQKGFGGEMIGLWGYYLLSPFNLILLLFKDHQLVYAIPLLIYLKLLAAALTCHYMITKRYKLAPIYQICFSLAYAYMSFTVVYLLNVMWLDALVLFPLVSLGLYYLFTYHQPKLYLFSLLCLLITNFYMAYMCCLFLAIYALYTSISLQQTPHFKQTLKNYLNFIIYSILAVLLASPILIPIFKSLLHNKIALQANQILDFSEKGYNLIEIFSKYIIGAYHPNEMSVGSPNIYVSMLVLIFAILYFFIRSINWRHKLMAFGVLIVFYLGFHFRWIDKVWHGGSYPIWYYYRYAFLFSFFLIELAIKAVQTMAGKIYFKQALSLLIGGTSIIAYYYLTESNQSSFAYLTPAKLFYSLLVWTLTLLLCYFAFKANRYLNYQNCLLLLIMLEVSFNASQILGQINYVALSKFNDYTLTLQNAVEGLKPSEEDFYRIHTIFQRTKDEAFYAQYSGLNHFGSTIEANASNLYGYLGLPDGSGFINYTNGTLFTDDFFNLRYQIVPSPDTAKHTQANQYLLSAKATDLDIQAYKLIYQHPRYHIYENNDRLGLAFEVSPLLTQEKNPLSKHQPIANQEYLLKLIDFEGEGQPFYTEEELGHPIIQHLKVEDTGQGDYKTYQKQLEPGNLSMSATMTYHFIPTSDHPYYFSLPSQYANDSIDLNLNGQAYHFYSPFKQRQVINAAFGNAHQTQAFEITFKQDKMEANSLHLYQFDYQRYQKLMTKKQGKAFKITRFRHHKIDGEIETKQEQGYLLFTIPYDENWTVTDNGQPVKPLPVLNDTLMAIPITAGHHQIHLSYFPHSFWLGLALCTIAISILILARNKSKNFGLNN